MTLEQMRYFLSIAKTSNMTKSAEELFVSQPTLSLTMKELEHEVGCPLFYKKGNRLALTESGSILQEEVSKILAQYEQMESRISSGELNRNFLRFGFSTIIGNTIAPQICSRFLDEYPEIQLQTTEDFGQNLLYKLDNDLIDVVVTGTLFANLPEWANRFHTQGLIPARLWYYVSKNHPLANKKQVSIEELAATPTIMLNRNFPISQNLEREFLVRNMSLNVVARSSQMYTVERFISVGVGGGFLPQESSNANSAIVAVNCEELNNFTTFDTMLYWKNSSTQSPSLRNFIRASRRLVSSKT